MRSEAVSDGMIWLVTIVHIIVCVFLIIVVLLQSGKAGDIAAAFGGASQTAFGPRGAATALGKATTWSAVIFMITSITLSILAAKRPSGNSVLQGLKPSTTQQQAPSKPATPPTVPQQPPK